MALLIGMPTRFGIFIDLPPEFLKRKHALMVKAALFKLPRAWQLLFLPEHFKPIAQVKYGYKQRTDKYLRRKRKVKGHQIPMVFSWRTKNRLTGQRPSVRGTAKSVLAKFKTPWYVKMRPTKRNAPVLGDEITKTIPVEARQLAARLGNNFEAELRKALPASRKIRRIQ